MTASRNVIFRNLVIVLILCIPGIINAQVYLLDSSLNGLSDPDTSDYIPVFYNGALDYNLMIAASKGYPSEIDRLMSKGADVNALTNEGATPLVFAVINNRESAVEALLKYNPLLDAVTTNNETPLLISVKNRNFPITESLIRAGASIDLPDRNGATPLHHAAVYGYFDIVDLLIYYGASIDEKSDGGTTPLLASIWAGYPDVADLLIQYGANMEARNNEGYSPFLMAAFYGDTLIMDLLYKKGVDIYAYDKSKHNALTLSIIAGRSYAVKFLLEMGYKWNINKDDTVDPYRVATKYHRKDIIEILEKYNVPGQIKYEIDQAILSVSSRLTVNDILTGASLSFKEPYLGSGIIVGCDMKLWYTRVLKKESENLYYQYMDKGAVAYAGLFKDFALTDRIDRTNFMFTTSLLAGYSFGNKLKGTNITSGNKLMVIPSVSFKLIKNNFSLFLGLEYLKTEYYQNGPVWARVGCSYNHFFDNVRTRVKTKKWY